MTLASVAMLAVTALTVTLCVLARRRFRERADFLAASVGLGLVGAGLVYASMSLSHGSEQSNMGDGLLMLLLLPANFFALPLVAYLASRVA